MGQGLYGPGPIWARDHMGQGPHGPGLIWARSHMGQGLYGPGPIWGRAHMGQGPYGPGPYGLEPIWARAHMGPGPLGPGPFLVGRTPHQKTHPGKKSPNDAFLLFFGNKKDAQRPYDHFGGGIAPRSLLCVRKRRFPFCKKSVNSCRVVFYRPPEQSTLLLHEVHTY